jgi:hypothetical protein
MIFVITAFVVTPWAIAVDGGVTALPAPRTGSS